MFELMQLPNSSKIKQVAIEFLLFSLDWLSIRFTRAVFFVERKR